MKLASVAGSVIVAVALVVWVFGAREGRVVDLVASEPVVLAFREAPFREDEPGARTLAWIRTEVVQCGPETVELELRASALGALVDAPPGWTNVRGANRITARELERLLAEGGLELVTRGSSLADARRTVAAEGTRCRVPGRALLPDGSIAWDAPGEEGVLEVVLASGKLGPGRYRSEVVARSRARLFVEFDWDGQVARILALESLAGENYPLTEAP